MENWKTRSKGKRSRGFSMIIIAPNTHGVQSTKLAFIIHHHHLFHPTGYNSSSNGITTQNSAPTSTSEEERKQNENPEKTPEGKGKKITKEC